MVWLHRRNSEDGVVAQMAWFLLPRRELSTSSSVAWPPVETQPSLIPLSSRSGTLEKLGTARCLHSRNRSTEVVPHNVATTIATTFLIEEYWECHCYPNLGQFSVEFWRFVLIVVELAACQPVRDQAERTDGIFTAPTSAKLNLESKQIEMLGIFARVIIISSGLSVLSAESYKIAYFSMGDYALGTLFSDYLNDQVGSLFSPPITFESTPAREAGYPDFPELIEAGDADFVYAPAIHLACFSAKYDYGPIGTAQMKIGSEMLGGTILVRADDEEIVSLADIKDKVVVGLPIPVLTGFTLQAATIAAAGLHVLQDAKKVIFVNRYVPESQFDLLLSGAADVAFVTDNELPARNDQHLFRVLHNIATPSEPPRSTQQIPQFGLSARPGMRSDVKAAVMRALSAVNTSHPAAAGVRTVLTFTLPASYGLTRSVMEEQGTIVRREGGEWECLTSPQLNFEAISCPPGFLKLDKQRVLSLCQERGTPCPLPAPASCVCKPCIQAEEVTLHCPTSLTATADCRKSELCAESEQRRPLRCVLTDNLLRDPTDMTFRLTDGLEAIKEGQGEYIGNFSYEFELLTSRAGSFLLEVRLGEEQVSASPTYIRIAPRNCAHAGPLRAPDAEGDCVCRSASTLVAGECRRTEHVAVAIGLPIVALIAAVVAIWFQRKLRQKGDALWMIPIERLDIDDEPELLGQGAYGVVFKATYQGTEVAVKRAVHRRATARRASVQHTAPSSPGLNPSVLHKEWAGPESPMATRASAADPRAVSISVSPQCPPVDSQPPALRLPSRGMGDPDASTLRKGQRGSLVMFSTGWDTALSSSSNGNAGSFAHEMRTLASLRHPNITTVMGAAKSKSGECLLVMEYMQYGSLSDLLANAAVELDGDVVHPLLLDVISGMNFLHISDPPIVHGDLKPSNVLVDERFRAKIADFGMANTKQRRAGTELWMAPEVLTGGRPTVASDVFAFGILLAEVLSRRVPYDGEDLTNVLRDVADKHVAKRPEVPASSPELLKVMMRRCWEHDPAERLSFASMQAMMGAVKIEEYPASASKRAQGQGIVYDMFPRHVADKLMAGEAVPDDRAECATVFFSDIVGFTSLSATLESHQVSEMLDRLFGKMDAAAKDIGVHKIETIGDCYIAVSNLVSPQPSDHVSRMARFSLAAMQACRDTLIDPANPDKGHVVIRVGFDSGPVVGSVVGSTYKKYTIFGNTVNTASRMESTGVPGRIQCSERAAELLGKEGQGQAEFQLEERGKVEVKGKGPMTTFFLNPPPGLGHWQDHDSDAATACAIGAA